MVCVFLFCWMILLSFIFYEALNKVGCFPLHGSPLWTPISPNPLQFLFVDWSNVLSFSQNLLRQLRQPANPLQNFTTVFEGMYYPQKIYIGVWRYLLCFPCNGLPPILFCIFPFCSKKFTPGIRRNLLFFPTFFYHPKNFTPAFEGTSYPFFIFP